MSTTMVAFQLGNGAFTYMHSLTPKPDNDQHRLYLESRYQLYYLISGSVDYQIEGKSYSLLPGDLLIFNNKEMHRPYFSTDESYERILVFFKPQFCSHYCSPGYDLLQYFERKKPASFNRLPASIVEEAQLRRYFTEIEQLGQELNPQNRLLIELTFIRLLVHINELISSYSGPDEPTLEQHEKLERIIRYIHDHLSVNMTLDEIEGRFHINKYYFSHLFKKTMGVSFKQYVLNKRLSKAAALLKLSVPPAEAARLSGFEDYSNFYKAFTKATGVAPSKYT
ncbi:AraC family transcriptional regulator [Paenibacillus sp. GD4]|jgi:AraC-like DNA-binding protein|uniref:AraC family transcriptional regulator n=1 Tax=Paenibacillus sp. GD4 TaxID=3068890 RepID=UPI002796D4ED|nr:AraC family transcriptional regulator [Paenibacillus sp. GD4]MDQ1913407.1 AraC family transcriptional regulator [Paenibacillus sp. GD4]